jgi:hypothetical protein
LPHFRALFVFVLFLQHMVHSCKITRRSRK